MNKAGRTGTSSSSCSTEVRFWQSDCLHLALVPGNSTHSFSHLFAGSEVRAPQDRWGSLLFARMAIRSWPDRHSFPSRMDTSTCPGEEGLKEREVRSLRACPQWGYPSFEQCSLSRWLCKVKLQNCTMRHWSWLYNCGSSETHGAGFLALHT